jgi:hypothetical protein
LVMRSWMVGRILAFYWIINCHKLNGRTQLIPLEAHQKAKLTNGMVYVCR